MLAQGRVIAQGELNDVFSRIELPYVQQEDSGVVIQGSVAARDEQWHLSQISFADQFMWLRDNGDDIGQTVRVRILARDVSIVMSIHDDSSILNRLAAQVVEISSDKDDAMALIKLSVSGEFIIARITRKSLDHLALSVGQNVWAQIKSAAIVR